MPRRLADDILMEMRMIELGIIPTNSGAPSNALKTMDQEDARKARRKFRKLWRKACKYLEKTEGLSYDDLCGVSREAQTLSQKRFRRGIVARMIREALIKE